MPTINADLFVRYVPGDPLDTAHNRLLFNQLGGTPTIPPMNAGDTLNFSVFFLDVGPGGLIPYQDHRYAGASVQVRLRANNHVYADSGATSSEIVPGTGAAVVRTQAGGAFVTEKQSVTFAAGKFLTGTFKIRFTGAGSGGRGGGVSLGNPSPYEAITAPIPLTASAADVLAAILAVRGYYSQNDGPYTFDELAGRYGASIRRPSVTGTPATGFVIEFGDIYGGSNWWNNGIHLVTIDDSGVQYAYGWTVPVALTAGDFTDLFLLANAPAYLEVLITPSGESQSFAAQYLLTSSGGVVGDPPPPVPGGGGPPGNVDGIIYDGDHFSSAWAVGVMRSETAFHEKPGYMIFRQRYRIARSSYADLPLDTPCPKDGNAFLVEETERQDVGGADLQEWDRVWAHVPPAIVDCEMVDYVWQTTGHIGGAGGPAAIRSIPLTRKATRTRTFVHTSNPTTIPVLILPRAMVFAGVLLAIGPYVDLYGGATTIARDDKIDRWMGNIWVKTHWDITI